LSDPRERHQVGAGREGDDPEADAESRSDFHPGDRRQRARDQAGLPREAADAKAEHNWTSLLQQGLSSPWQFLFAVEDIGSGERIGDLWYAERDGESGKRAGFVYSVEIFEGFRGRGFGRQAMLLIEDEARSRGLSQISLTVFGGNDVARSLYRSLSYAETAVFMAKDL
jgi:ribosomal protein S18 acetylase RimI-like enzyme